MQLLLLAALALLMNGKENSNLSGLLSAFMQPAEPDSEKDVDEQIDEVLSHIAGENFSEVMKMARVLEGVTKTFSAAAPKVFEAEEATAQNTPESGGFYPLAPVQNIADGEILHALSGALG